MIDTAIILAGGFGTRLRTVVSELPKPMAPIEGKPFLAYLLDYLLCFEIKHVILSVGYLHETIESYFGNEYKGMTISYSIEETPLGTGGGIKLALQQTNGDVFILNGDTFFAVDLKVFTQFHQAQKTDLSLALKTLENFDRYGTVSMEGDKIIGFREKESVAKGVINGGIYITSKEVLKAINLPLSFSLEKDFLEPNLENLHIRGFISDGYFIDIGIPEDYFKAIKELPHLIQA